MIEYKTEGVFTIAPTPSFKGAAVQWVKGGGKVRIMQDGSTVELTRTQVIILSAGLNEMIGDLT